MQKHFVLILILFCVNKSYQTSENEEGVKVDPLPSGIFYSKLGTANIYRGTFEYFILYDVKYIKMQKQTLHDLQNQLKDLKPNDTISKTQSIIDSTLNIMKYLIRVCDENQRSILERRKRSVLSWIMSFLFGVNDEAYASINELQLQNQELKKMETDANVLLNDKIAETQDVFQSKVTAILNETNDFQQIFKKQQEKILQLHNELQIFETVSNIHERARNIMIAVNRFGLWTDHFNFDVIDNAVKESNNVLKLKNLVSSYFRHFTIIHFKCM